jgi:glycosyltransferase involved in cell wall biosynthesis
VLNLRSSRFLLRQFIDRNTKHRKRTSSGRDLVIYCDYTGFIWHPQTKGFSGSEEATINLARELSKLGWHVTVYNNCGHDPLWFEGVIYRPFWEFNPRDRQDVVILWRWPKPLDWEINAKSIFIDSHDTTNESFFTNRNRLSKVNRLFLKSNYHRSLFPNIPDHKIAVIPNGIDLSLLEGAEQKDPFLLVNTSAADRSMSVLPKLFREVKQRMPQARLQWTVGWDLFKFFNNNRPNRIEWMNRTREEMQQAGIESLGNLDQAQLGKLYQRGAILAYPTDFYELDCISVRKAQACGCVPVTTNFAALEETVQFGIKIPCKRANTAKSSDRFFYGIEDPEAQRLWVDATVDLLTNPEKRMALAEQGAKWARQFSWPAIAARWDQILRD